MGCAGKLLSWHFIGTDALRSNMRCSEVLRSRIKYNISTGAYIFRETRSEKKS